MMKFHVVEEFPKGLDAIIVRVVEGEKRFSSPSTKRADTDSGGLISAELRRRTFKMKAGETVILNTPNLGRVVVLAVHKSGKVDHYRQNNAELVKALRAHRLWRVGDARGQKPNIKEVMAAITEGSLLGDYSFDKYKSGERRREIEFYFRPGQNGRAEMVSGIAQGRTTAEAQILARDLANEPPSHLTPTALAAEARRIARKTGLGISVMGPAEIKRVGMGAFLAVARGSDEPPRLIRLTYRPRGAKRHVVLVGKSITYDAGGINLKPTKGGSLEDMKMDMSGGAAVLGAMSALKRLGIKHSVTGYLPATENLLGGSAFKPGDVVRTVNGKTIEVGNTDAEGRLTLADALAYAVKRDKPDELIDLATLTATDISLGPDYAAVFATNDRMERRLKESGERTGERVWPLPFPRSYDEMTKSPVADFSNIVPGRAYTLSGPLLLRHFVGKTPWVHLDIGGPAIAEKDRGYIKKGGSGWGVRLLLDYLGHA